MSGPLRGLVIAVVAWAGLSARAPAPAAGQTIPPRGVAVLTPDSIRVGEPFGLGVSVRSDSAPEFPPILRLPEAVEQLAPPEVARVGAGQWRAIYRLTAWQTGTHDLPPLALRSLPGADSLSIRPPPVTVLATLPSDGGPLGLRPPRIPDLGSGFPWWWLLLAALAAALGEALRRWLAARRRSGEEVEGRGPGETARADLEALRARALASEATGAAFYDELERILRVYLVRTRDWPPGAPALGPHDGPPPPATGPAASADRGLETVARHAAPVRFGALAAPSARELGDLAVALAWLETVERERAEALGSEKAGAVAADGGAAAAPGEGPA